jgi:hypothetical protein
MECRLQTTPYVGAAHQPYRTQLHPRDIHTLAGVASGRPTSELTLPVRLRAAVAATVAAAPSGVLGCFPPASGSGSGSAPEKLAVTAGGAGGGRTAAGAAATVSVHAKDTNGGQQAVRCDVAPTTHKPYDDTGCTLHPCSTKPHLRALHTALISRCTYVS